MKLFLRDNIAYPWVRIDDDCFRGYFIINDKYYSGEDAVNYIKQNVLAKKDDLMMQNMNELDGIFSFIISYGNAVYFAVDKLRGLPLFYCIENKELWLGDNINQMVNMRKINRANTRAIGELIDSNLFVLGKDTLIENVYQVRAADFCSFNKENKDIHAEQYFSSEHTDFYDDEDIDLLRDEFEKAYANTGQRLVKALKGRTAVVPLSGGADSRMVLDMLKKQKYENVICFTYGIPNNKESLISKKVAEEYKYEWHFIPYDKESIRRLRKNAEVEEYKKYSFLFCATPHFQDYYAVRELKRKKIIPENSVFVPGHSGDIPNGNHVSSLYMRKHVSKSDCLRNMLHFAFTQNYKSHEQHVLDEYSLPSMGTPQEYASIEEWLDTAERQAKFIVNSARVYEFFGYEWLIPLWDNSQFNFWRRVSLSWRYKRKLYYFIVDDRMPSTNDVTKKKRFESFIRKIPVAHQCASRIRRVQNWWISPLQLEHYYSAWEYFKACLCEKSTFDFNTLLSKKIAKYVEKQM